MAAAALVLRRDFLRFADAATPGLALGLALTRTGCWLAGCDYGVPLGPDAPRLLTWAGSFPLLPAPVHPTQLYEAALGVVLLAASLSWLTRAPRGVTFAATAVFYALLRFVLEWWRGGADRGVIAASAAVAVAPVVLGLAAALVVLARRLEPTWLGALGLLTAAVVAVTVLDGAVPASLSTSQLVGLGVVALTVLLFRPGLRSPT